MDARQEIDTLKQEIARLEKEIQELLQITEEQNDTIVMVNDRNMDLEKENARIKGISVEILAKELKCAYYKQTIRFQYDIDKHWVDIAKQIHSLIQGGGKWEIL